MMENSEIIIKERKQILDQLAHDELFANITREKRLEIMGIHKVLVYKYIKRQNMELYLKNRLYKWYDQWMNEFRIEHVYHLPVQKFMVDALNGKLN